MLSERLRVDAGTLALARQHRAVLQDGLAELAVLDDTAYVVLYNRHLSPPVVIGGMRLVLAILGVCCIALIPLHGWHLGIVAGGLFLMRGLVGLIGKGIETLQLKRFAKDVRRWQGVQVTRSEAAVPAPAMPARFHVPEQ